MKYKILCGDAIKMMATLPDQSVDMIMTDPPYGSTACAWDEIIPIDPMWKELKRIVKENAAIILTATQPFASLLITSNLKAFKYEWIYEKTNPKGFLSASRRPLTAHENVLVFSYGAEAYSPQKWRIPEHLRTKRKHATSKTSGEVYGDRDLVRWDDDGSRYPTSVIGFSNRVGRDGNYHPTQKPVALMEYLIETYSNEGDTVLDFACGSGTTGVACRRTGRNFIGIEKAEKYAAIAEKRIAECDGPLFAGAA